MSQSVFIEGLKRLLGGNPSVRKVADDLQLTSELILLTRMMFADGMLKAEEKISFQKICVSVFGLEPDDIPQVVQYLKDFGYETSSWDAAAMFNEMDDGRKRLLLLNMLEIAKSDNELHSNEAELIKKTAETLGLSPEDIANTH
ncbi:MAG: TerB family tellurite resistance protein [Nitratireductor sp.]